MDIKKNIIFITILLSMIGACFFGCRYFQLQKLSTIVSQFIEKRESEQIKPIIEISSEGDLRKLLQENEQPCVIFLHIDDCSWCEKMAPVLQNVSKNPIFKLIQFYSVNGRESEAISLIDELFDQSISGYPSLLFINKKGFLNKKIGFLNENDFITKIKRIFSDLLTGQDPTLGDTVQDYDSENDVEIQCGTCGGNCCSWYGGCCSCQMYHAGDCAVVCSQSCNCESGHCVDGVCYIVCDSPSVMKTCSECSCTGDGCICSSNSDCDSDNCYLGFCAAKVGNCGVCGDDGNCSSGDCTNGVCYITGCKYGMETCGNCFGGAAGDPCNGNENCSSGDCTNGICACHDAGCPCTSNSECDSGNCYDYFCENCIIPSKNAAEAEAVNDEALSKSGGSKGLATPICYNNGQCCNCVDGKCSSNVSCKSGTCIIDGDMVAPDLNQQFGSGAACTANSDCSSNLCVNGNCSCGDTGPGCTCLEDSTCQSGLVCTNNICAQPCAASGGACTQTTDCCAPLNCLNGICGCVASGDACSSTSDCCTGYTCSDGTCNNNDVTCTENSDCTSGICLIGANGGACASCGDNDWQGCTADIQCCTGNSCVIESDATSGYCGCNTTGCSCIYNYNCQSGVCVEGNSGKWSCSASCLADGAACQDSGQCCDGTTCIEDSNGSSYCATCGSNNSHNPSVCSSNDDCCSNICAGGFCSCDTNGCACSDGSTCQTGVCLHGVCNCSSYNATCSSDENCCSKVCSNGKCGK